MEVEWEETTLGQLVADGSGFIQTGPFGSQLHASDYVSEGVPVIMPVNLKDNRISLDEIARISEEDANRLSKHIVQKGDIVYSRRGDVTRKALITEDEAGMFCGTGCLLVRPGKSVDSKFLTYHLTAPVNQEWIVRHAIGATMPNLNTGILSCVPLNLPPIEEQKSIAHILGTLDDKIELNRQMNATLEAMAQVLFKSWFVDFDPVIDNALAAGNPIPEPLHTRAEARKALGDQRKPLPEGIQNQFPNRFVFNDDMGWVPEGWVIQNFGELIETTIGGDWGKEESDIKHRKRVTIIRGTDIPSIKSGAIGSTPTRWIEEKKFNTRELCDGDIVIEVSGGSPKQPTGRAVYVTTANLKMLGGSCVPASFCRRLRPKCKVLGLYAALHLDRIYAIGKMWGYQNQSTGISNFQTKTFLDTEYVVLPENELILGKFFETVRPVIDRTRTSENEDLAKIRDTLLPKLLSGQLRIPEAEQQLAEAL